jgi:chromosomal replication initiation ATPase DnaA
MSVFSSSDQELHLFLSQQFSGPKDAIYAPSARAALQLLETGRVTHITFGADWQVSGAHCGLACRSAEHCTVACYIRNAVLEAQIPKVTWSVLSTDPVTRDTLTQIMESVDAFCRWRARPIEPVPPRPRVCWESGIDSNLTFETFIPEDGLFLAWSQATIAAVCRRPDKNPLLFFGAKGVGKTHLLHAVGYRLLMNHPGIRLWCSNGQQILKASASEESWRKFDLEKRCENLEVLLVDDIHLLAQNLPIQRIFDQIVTRLVSQGKSLILTADWSLAEARGFDAAFASPAGTGMVAEMHLTEQHFAE